MGQTTSLASKAQQARINREVDQRARMLAGKEAYEHAVITHAQLREESARRQAQQDLERAEYQAHVARRDARHAERMAQYDAETAQFNTEMAQIAQEQAGHRARYDELMDLVRNAAPEP